jgi:hypothetical protein
MRIRSIKPEFWRSDDIDALDWHDRLLFIGLWSYVDDNGVGRDKVANIAADIFAGDLSVDPTETLRRVSLGLNTLDKNGQITRYRVGGKDYLHVTAWERHQLVKNPNKARYPLPTWEQGNRGTGEQRNRGFRQRRVGPSRARRSRSSTMAPPRRRWSPNGSTTAPRDRLDESSAKSPKS